MSQTINIPNYNPANIVATVTLEQEVKPGDSTFVVDNSISLATGNTIIVGLPGDNATEAFRIASVPSSTSVTVATPATLYHSSDTPVARLLGTQVKIYRAPNDPTVNLQPADTAFAPLTTISIAYNSSLSKYSDATGSNAYWYKFTYYDPDTSTETDLADSKSVRGGGSGNYTTLDAIRQEAGFIGAPFISDVTIAEKRAAAEDEINGTLHEIYPVPFAAPVNAFIASIATRLAAGLLLLEEYPEATAASGVSGQAKVDDARLDLDRLILKEVVLTDATGTSTALPGSTGGVSGWPDDSTTDAPRLFHMSDIQGYYGRQF